MIHEHHRKRRSQGGDDSPSNKIGLPDVLHDWVHANPEKAYEIGLLVHSWEEPESVMITIPEEFIKVKKERKKREPAKEKVIYSIRSPKDEKNVLPELEDAIREKYREEMGWSEDVPAYFVWSLAGILALEGAFLDE